MGTDGEETRYRVCVLGAGHTGKTSIVQRFLHNSFNERYRETVEELHCREFNVQGIQIKVDLLDTAGKLEFPAMERLYIATADAFVLVFAINEIETLNRVVKVMRQIAEQRGLCSDIPIVVVGNKLDLWEERRLDESDLDEALDAAGIHLPFCYIEVSAKENANVLEVFHKLLSQTSGTMVKVLSPILKRRISVRDHARTMEWRGRSHKVLTASSSVGVTRETETEKKNLAANLCVNLDSRHKRSRSLISRRRKPQMTESKDPHANDCCLS